jgi:hypothetical protein
MVGVLVIMLLLAPLVKGAGGVLVIPIPVLVLELLAAWAVLLPLVARVLLPLAVLLPFVVVLRLVAAGGHRWLAATKRRAPCVCLWQYLDTS